MARPEEPAERGVEPKGEREVREDRVALREPRGVTAPASWTGVDTPITVEEAGEEEEGMEEEEPRGETAALERRGVLPAETTAEEEVRMSRVREVEVEEMWQGLTASLW